MGSEGVGRMSESSMGLAGQQLGQAASHLAVEEAKEVKHANVLTNELNRLVEPGADVSLVVVLHRDALVEERILKVVGAVGGDVDESGDA